MEVLRVSEHPTRDGSRLHNRADLLPVAHHRLKISGGEQCVGELWRWLRGLPGDRANSQLCRHAVHGGGCFGCRADSLQWACTANYQGVIFAYGGDYYNIPSWQSTLISYEQTFNMRQLNWYDVPDPNYGLSYTGTQIPDTSTYTTNFTAAAAPVFFYANTATPLTIANASVDLATADVAAGGSLTPLLQDASGNIVSAIYNLNGQQFLTQTFDSNPYLTHDLVVAYGLLNWVTKGVFLGDYHVYATQEIDDFFINDSEWIPSTTCLTNLATKDRTLPDASNLPVFRVDANDMAQLVAWQTTKQADPLLSPGATYETTAASGNSS
jgi:hypothetical protein